VARDIGMRFNHVFGETFVIPEPAIEEKVATVPGIDGQKMSKSYDNTIPIFWEGKQLKKQVMAIQTDSTPVEEPKDPGACNLYNIFKLFAPAERLAEIRKLYVEGGAAYGYIKLELVDLIENYYKEARGKRAELLQDKESLRKILAHGALKAREKAAPTLDLVRQKVGLNY
jgi:tryptophanyl-tRNA synthetase